jgi:hypothetical protein
MEVNNHQRASGLKIPETFLLRLSLNEMATSLSWFYSNGDPDKSQVNRIVRKLEKQKVVKKVRDRWELTKAGTQEAQAVQARERANETLF